jgi:hypothetical protein
MDTQEDLEPPVPIVEAAPAAEVVGDSDKKEVIPEEQKPQEPPTPRIPKRRPPRPTPAAVAPAAAPPPPIADPQFWSDMIATKRVLDREATRSRYANLVKF